MTDNEIIKAFNEGIGLDDIKICIAPSFFGKDSEDKNEYITLATIRDVFNRQKAENNDLLCKLTGVMHSVDKWLSVDELKQDEVVRAITMREKTLRIVEKLHEKIEELEEEKEMLRASKSEAVKEFAERYERYLLSQLTTAPLDKKEWINFCLEYLDNLKKEMVGEK